MKITFCVALLLFFYSLSAQHTPSKVYAFGEDANSSSSELRYASGESSYLEMGRNRERELNQWVEKYKDATAIHQSEIRKTIHGILGEMVDLRILMKEEEIRELGKELTRLKVSVAYQEKQAEILELESRIASVRSRLRSRKEHKKQIVDRRLTELLN